MSRRPTSWGWELQRQLRLIPIADERVGCAMCVIPERFSCDDSRIDAISSVPLPLRISDGGRNEELNIEYRVRNMQWYNQVKRGVIEFRRLSLRVLPQLSGNCTYICGMHYQHRWSSLGHSPPSKKASVITTATWPYRPPVRDTRPSRTALYWNMKLHVGLIMQRNLQEILR